MELGRTRVFRSAARIVTHSQCNPFPLLSSGLNIGLGFGAWVSMH